jgi:hypothetical protein
VLQNHTGKEINLTEYGFLVAVELQDDVDIDMVANKLQDALTWVEGVGRTDIHVLGPIENIPLLDENTDVGVEV